MNQRSEATAAVPRAPARRLRARTAGFLLGCVLAALGFALHRFAPAAPVRVQAEAPAPRAARAPAPAPLGPDPHARPVALNPSAGDPFAARPDFMRDRRPRAPAALVDLTAVGTGPVTTLAERSAKVPSERCRMVTGSGDCADPEPGDRDRDGYREAVDCDDTLDQVHPGAREVRCNQLDEDCDGSDFCPSDADGDGVFADEDCDDRNPARNRYAPEQPCNGIDEDCSGADACDRDGDGDPAAQDCDDREASRHTGARDLSCDGVDQDCDGKDCCDQDRDGDGHPCRRDCNDGDARIHPGAALPPGCYTTDLNCDGIVDGKDCL